MVDYKNIHLNIIEENHKRDYSVKKTILKV